MDKPVSQVLEEAADLLEQPGAWTQGNEARDKDGCGLLGDEDGAVCWCMIGAVRRVGGYRAQDKARPFISKLIRGAKPWTWNDRACRTQPEVVAKLREAAALAKEQGR